jgi:hypothetical protein
MSAKRKYVPRDQYVNQLSVDQLKDFYIKADSRKPAPARASTVTSYRGSTVSGRGAYKATTAKAPVKKASLKSKPRGKSVPKNGREQSFRSDYGSRLGSVVGEGLQSLANVFGFGEYSIQQNSCLSMVDMGTSPPRVVNTNKGEATIVNHREYLGDLLTGTGPTGGPSVFNITGYPLNPGNSELFPFLAPIAWNFQEYEVRGMLVELKSMCSDYAASLSLGSMFVAAEYSVLQPAPTDKIQVENLEYACSNKPSNSIIMPIECKRTNTALDSTHLYTAVDGEYLGGDARLYDMAAIYIGSYGCPTAVASPIAEIWVTYEIALFKPKLYIPPAPEPTCGYYADHYSLATVSVDKPFGYTRSSDTANNLDLTVTDNTVIFPEVSEDRVYFVTFYVVGSASVSSFIGGVTTAGGAVKLDSWFSTSTAIYNSYNAYNTEGIAGTKNLLNNFVISVPADTVGANFVYESDGVFPSGTTFGDLVVSVLPPGMVGPFGGLPRPIESLTDEKKKSLTI